MNFMDGFCKGLDELCYTTTEKQRNEALPSIRYFQVSLLRSYMPLGQLFFWCLPMIAIIFLTEKGVSVLIRADDMAGPMVRLQEDLYQIAGEYRGRILHSDADRALTETMYSVNHQLADRGAALYVGFLICGLR